MKRVLVQVPITLDFATQISFHFSEYHLSVFQVRPAFDAVAGATAVPLRIGAGRVRRGAVDASETAAATAAAPVRDAPDAPRC